MNNLRYGSKFNAFQCYHVYALLATVAVGNMIYINTKLLELKWNRHDAVLEHAPIQLQLQLKLQLRRRRRRRRFAERFLDLSPLGHSHLHDRHTSLARINKRHTFSRCSTFTFPFSLFLSLAYVLVTRSRHTHGL